MFGRFSSKTIWAWRFPFQEFKITGSISLIVTGLIKLTLSWWVCCSGLCFLGNWPILYKLLNLCGQDSLQHSLIILLMSLGFVVIPHFIPDTVTCVFYFCQSCQRFGSFLCSVDFSLLSFCFSVSAIYFLTFTSFAYILLFLLGS